MEVGDVYRFAGERQAREYGDWEIVEIDQNGGVRADGPQGKYMLMCHTTDLALGGSSYTPVLVRKAGPDAIEQMFA